MSLEKDNEVKTTRQNTDADGPKFGRLLVVLLLAVSLIIALTFATEAYYST
jgi:hypothetical protein